MSKLTGHILKGKILIKPIESVKKTASGIIIPDSAVDKPKTGEVVLLGEPKEPFEVVIGDAVLYGTYSGTEVVIEEEKYLLMTQNDILFILTK